MSQEYEIGDASGEVEISEGEMDELGIEEIQNWRKCSKCNRPCSGHEGSTGQKCKLNILTTQEEFSTYYSELKEKLKGKKKQKTKKTPRKQSIPTSVAEDTPVTNVGGGGQVMIDSSLLQQLVIALQGSQVLESRRGGSVPPNLENRGDYQTFGSNNMSNNHMRQQQFQQQMNQQMHQQQWQGYQQGYQGQQPGQQPGVQQGFGGFYQPPPHYFMQPTAVPKFHKTMSVDGWRKNVTVWSSTHLHLPEAMRLTMILESLYAKEDRKVVGRWIVSTIDEGDFDVSRPGALEDFLNKFKKKFEGPSWRKCVEL